MTEMTMNKVGEFHFLTESYLLDFRGRTTIPMIGNYLLHAASTHAEERGFGFSDMEKRNAAWVLSRLAIEIRQYPKMSEKLTLYTWVEEVGKLFTNRSFEIVNEQGETYVYARSIWAAINMESRRPTLLDIEGLNAYVTDRDCPIEKPGKIVPVENLPAAEVYRVKYSDLDVNGHLNSIKYMEHLLNLFGLELFREKEIHRFEIAYQSEGKYGMDLTLHAKETAPDKYAMAICHEGKAICRAAVTWA